MKFYELLKLLDGKKHIDPEVENVVTSLNPKIDRTSILGASLGGYRSIIETLTDNGIIPDKLNEDEKQNLADLYGADISELIAFIRKKPEVCATFLGMSVPQLEARKKPLPLKAQASYPLFPHQVKALNRVKGIFNSGRDRVIMHMPTGAGKTRTSMNLVCDTLRSCDKGVVLWLASTKELLEQAAYEFERAWGFLGNRDVNIYAQFDGNSLDIETLADGLMVASLGSLNSMLKKLGPLEFEKIGDNLQLIIFDEAHQSVAPTYRQVIDKLAYSSNKPIKLLGLTATPGRSFVGREDDEELATFFNENKVMLEAETMHGSSNPVEYLIENGYLANAEFELIEYKESRFEELESHTAEGKRSNYLYILASKVLELTELGHSRVIVFTVSVDLAYKLASILLALGVKAQAVDGGLDKNERQRRINEYCNDSSDTKVLVNCQVLTTGFDAPKTSAAVIGRGTQSLTLYSQMVGRAIRGPKAGGNKFAYIATLVDPSIPQFGDIAQAFTHWNEYWD